MNGRTHTVQSALRTLKNKRCLYDNQTGILAIPDNHELGNKSWGIVDFLLSEKVFIFWVMIPEKERQYFQELPV